jgi:3-dehydroquinate dehydratase/shikimate dehydrogenase
MICITGLESSVVELFNRLTRCRDHPMQEIRLDALKESLPPAEALPVAPENLVICCRRPEDGGRFHCSETERLMRLEQALQWKPGWLDVEADLEEGAERHLLERAHIFGVKVLRSLHLLEENEAGAILKAIAFLSSLRGDGIKLAARVDDVIQLEELLVAPRSRTSVLLGTGSAGLLSRVLHRRFQSAWTYVSEQPWPDPSAGIPDLPQAMAMGMPVRESGAFYALIGGPSITASPGPSVYNCLFRRKGFDGVYLPAVTNHLPSAFGLLCRLNLKGASVTIPHKVDAMELASVLGRAVRFSGAVNTLTRMVDGRWRADNTDIPALQALVEKAPGEVPGDAVVLGTGGLARASAYALTEMGIKVTLLGRQILLEEGPWLASWPLGEITRIQFDLLVNATPVKDDSLIPDRVDLKGKVVIDGVIAKEPTPLLKRAEAEGAYVAGGLAFWTEQGSRQLELFQGPEASPDELAKIADEWRSAPPPP